MLKNIREMMEQARNRKEAEDQIEDKRAQIDQSQADLNQLQEIIPQQIALLMSILDKMKSGIGSREATGDFWGEREGIRENLNKLKAIKKQVDEFFSDLQRRDKDFRNPDSSTFLSLSDFDVASTELDQLERRFNDVDGKKKAAFDFRNHVRDIRKEMETMCNLKVKELAQKRRNEIQNQLIKLEAARNQLNQLDKADEAFEGDQITESEINQLRYDIENQLQKYDLEARQISTIQDTKFNLPQELAFASNDIHTILTEIEQLRIQIEELGQGLDLVNKKLKLL